ncbi:sigma-70 family RNA polymerase sigma factor [Micromonospora echinospora]|uniref:sigma-70 family RNA polymerase sigma factor n=1 Tax=Micromonospora echinospora TaxID=1877 RepID=UPI003A85282E
MTRRTAVAAGVANTMLLEVCASDVPRHVPADEPEQQREWNLVRRAQDGDQDAFADLYRDNRDLVVGYLLARVGPSRRALAEDLASDTFYRAWRNLHRYTEPRKRIASWLNTIAHRLLLDHMKNHRFRSEIPVGLVHNSELLWGSNEGSAEAAAIRSHDLQQALAGLLALKPHERECLVRRFWEGHSTSDVAEAMGMTQAGVKSLQARALKKIEQYRASGKRLPVPATRRNGSQATSLTPLGIQNRYGRYARLDVSDDGETLRCHECGQWKRSLGRHASIRHGLTAAEYRHRHGLPAGQSLASPAARRRFAAMSHIQPGNSAWQALAEHRDPAHARAAKKAKASSTHSSA